MNRDRLKLWIDALRSGDYEQGQGALNKDNKFCCLGVLCEVAIKDGVKMEVRAYEYASPVDGGIHEAEMVYDGFTSFPPPAVRKWLEIDTSNVRVLAPSTYEPDSVESFSVVNLNDSQGRSFAFIADALEKTFLGGPA